MDALTPMLALTMEIVGEVTSVLAGSPLPVTKGADEEREWCKRIPDGVVVAIATAYTCAAVGQCARWVMNPSYPTSSHTGASSHCWCSGTLSLLQGAGGLSSTVLTIACKQTTLPSEEKHHPSWGKECHTVVNEQVAYCWSHQIRPVGGHF